MVALWYNMRVTQKKPVCYIIAGPNGAGKTTFALNYLPKITDCRDFINADEIAKGLSPLDFDAGLLQAGKLFMTLLNKKIEQRKDFAFETTLSGKAYIPKIVAWRKKGWRVVLIYLYIPSADFSASRVSQRVLQGGHNIPPQDIQRRYPRSIKNAFVYAECCDDVYCFDNSFKQITSVFEKHGSNPIVIQNQQIYAEMMEVVRHE